MTCAENAGAASVMTRDHRAPIVEIERLAEEQRFARPQLHVSDPVDGDGIGSAQIKDRAEDHARRDPGQRGIIDTEKKRALGAALGGLHRGRRLEEGNSPGNPGDAAHAMQLGVAYGPDQIDIFDRRIHHPDVDVGRVGDDVLRARHQADEQARLLGHQQGRERNAEDEA